MNDIDSLAAEADRSIAAAPDLAAVEALCVALLGKQGSVSALFKTLGAMPPEALQTVDQPILARYAVWPHTGKGRI